MSINTFLLILLVIAAYTNLFLTIKNWRKWKAFYFFYKLNESSFSWLIRVVGIIVIEASLIAYLIVQKKSSLFFSESNTDDLRHKALDNKHGNAEFAANRDHTD